LAEQKTKVEPNTQRFVLASNWLSAFGCLKEISLTDKGKRGEKLYDCMNNYHGVQGAY